MQERLARAARRSPTDLHTQSEGHALAILFNMPDELEQELTKEYWNSSCLLSASFASPRSMARKRGVHCPHGNT